MTYPRPILTTPTTQVIQLLSLGWPINKLLPHVKVDHEFECMGQYNGVLERPEIFITPLCPESKIEKVITHEIIHWVLHKIMGEDTSMLFDRVSFKNKL